MFLFLFVFLITDGNCKLEHLKYFSNFNSEFLLTPKIHCSNFFLCIFFCKRFVVSSPTQTSPLIRINHMPMIVLQLFTQSVYFAIAQRRYLYKFPTMQNIILERNITCKMGKKKKKKSLVEIWVKSQLFFFFFHFACDTPLHDISFYI